MTARPIPTPEQIDAFDSDELFSASRDYDDSAALKGDAP